MIPATEALRLPSAQLGPEELRAADALELAIEGHVCAHMSRAGCEEPFTTSEKNPSVLAEVNLRLMLKDWSPEWQKIAQRGVVSNEPIIIGWRLARLIPSERAYRAAAATQAAAVLGAVTEHLPKN